jgi:ATP-dependent RNA helicase RhlE
MSTFESLGLSEPLLKALAHEGYTTPTPIQLQAIPPVAEGRDLLGIAQTGTGKTAAFALPILQRLATLSKRPAPRTTRALILSPTRELATQIAESFRAYGRNLRISVATVFGGASHNNQARELARGLDVLVATPGRLLDHLNEGNLILDRTDIFVLDEADQMLDMGFIRDIRKIVRNLPVVRQSLFFSATMPQEIGKLAGELLRDPVQVAVAPVATTAEKVEQKVIFVNPAEKNPLLAELLADPSFSRVLVFARTKHGADKIVRFLEGRRIEAAAIHGNKSQPQRERALAGFKDGAIRVLIATDIAARGIDVDRVSHVVNYHLPNVPEQYVHRIGRTARAGATGLAVSFCDHEERSYLRSIEKLTRQAIPSLDLRGTLQVTEADKAASQAIETVVKPHEGRRQNAHRPRGGAGHPSGEHRKHGPAKGPGAAPGKGPRRRFKGPRKPQAARA